MIKLEVKKHMLVIAYVSSFIAEGCNKVLRGIKSLFFDCVDGLGSY